MNIANDFVVSATDASHHVTTVEVGPNTFDYAFTGLTPDENYTFGVAADAQMYDGSTGRSAPLTLTAAASNTDLTTSGPSVVDENQSGILTVDSGDPSVSTITGWTINWTDINGVSLQTDTVDGSGGTDDSAAGWTPGLIANVTATDTAGCTFTLPAFNMEVRPLPPTALAATAVSPSEIDLSWADASAFATQYQIMASTDGIHFSYFDAVDSSQTTYAAMGLSAGTTYTFDLAAVNPSYGDTGQASFTASATHHLRRADVGCGRNRYGSRRPTLRVGPYR